MTDFPPHDFYKKNVFNISDLDSPIYRIFSKKRFFETIKNKQLTLLRPKRWDDPFENFLLRQPAYLSTGEPISMVNSQNRLYGQCWTEQKESDAMWRIYSSNKDGIKVHATPRKLLDVLCNRSDKYAALKYFIGTVEYHTQEELVQYFSNSKNFTGIVLDTSAKGPVHALLLKRQEFAHEKEVRVIFQSSQDEIKDDAANFEIDPQTLFEEIELDPRLIPEQVEELTKEIRILGITCPIAQSALYKLPPMRFVIDA